MLNLAEFASDVLLAFLLASLLWVTFRARQDYWPYSRYPMFSGLLAPTKVEVYRCALETQTGEREWWAPRFVHLQRDFGNAFAAVWQGGHHQILISEQGRRLLYETVRAVQRTHGNRFTTLSVVRRTVRQDDHGEFDVDDHIVLTAPFEAIVALAKTPDPVQGS